MQLSKNIAIVVVITLLIAGLLTTLFFLNNRKTKKGLFTIGVLQTASHPALDAARSGFIQKMKELWGNQINFIDQNAQGSIAHAQTIAQSFHIRPDVDAIFAIATPATQAITSVEKNKPIFIAAVTDPMALGIIYPGTNVAGMSDMINIDDLIEVVKNLTPNVKTIGILFNIGEINSTILVEKMINKLNEIGLTPIKFGVVNEADIPAAIDNALQKTDLILAPTDNTVASTIKLITQRSLEAKKPFIASDNLLVKDGALAARGINYEESGKQAAIIATEILKNKKKPDEIPLAKPQKSKIFINEKMLHNLGLSIPENLKPDVELIK